MNIEVGDIINSNLNYGIVRIRAVRSKKQYDVRMFFTGSKIAPVPSLHIALWVKDESSGFPVDPDSEIVPAGISPGLALIITRDEVADPNIPVGEWLGNALNPSGMQRDETYWIPGLTDSDDNVRTGIGVGRDGSILIKGTGGEIHIGNSGVSISGKNVATIANTNKNGIAMMPNPLRFLPSLFFLPLPAQLPDFSIVLRLARIVKTLKSVVSHN